MEATPLQGRSILIVEDDPLIALEIAQAFEDAGANVLTAQSLEEALRWADRVHLSAAVVDFGLGDSDSGLLCSRLRQRGVSFLHYSGYTTIPCAGGSEPIVTKPASANMLITTMVAVLESRAA